MDSLSWRTSIPPEDDAFSFFTGSNNDLDGGFLSLEEIDEAEYIEISKQERGSKKPKKRKLLDINDGEAGGDEAAAEATLKNKKRKDTVGKEAAAEGTVIKKKRKDRKKEAEKKKKKKKKNANETVQGHNEADDSTRKEDNGELSVDESEFYAWSELRLHPMLMKSIYSLGFKEPTPIQKACVPAAAHQGKDVIGAAETGSGKTLAFGLPILQRLLDEQEKAANMLSEDAEIIQRIAPRGLLRALIITPTRELALQVTDHMKHAAKCTNIRVVAIVGGMSTQKQERLLKARPEIIVGTPGRLWELMSQGDGHLLHSLSFFVLDEADRMIESGHFRELQSIIDLLPTIGAPTGEQPQGSQNCITVSSFQRKKRQTFVFSATIALSSDFRKKLKRGSAKLKQSADGDLTSIENLSERAGMRADAAIVDLTSASIVADKLEESFLECREEDKDAYLYYILSVHGKGRTIVFCTSIAGLRHISSILRILGINVCTLHAQMQQRARLKAMDRFRGNGNGILIATDVAARGLDIPGVRTVIHYQLPHSAEVYVHRSGRTARASRDGCSVALISPNDRSKFASLCKSFSKELLRRFPVDSSYMPEVLKRLSLARQIDKISRKESQEKAEETWIKRNAESMELDLDDNDSEEERVNTHKKKKASTLQLKNLQQDLNSLLSHPLQPKTFSHRYLAGAGVSPLLQCQLEELARQPKLGDKDKAGGKAKLMAFGHDCVEPLQALRGAGPEDRMDMKELAEKQKNRDNLRRKRKEKKKRLQVEKRDKKRRLKEAEE
ncbi:hypothetical protein V2J09_017447 [Rumex salicifolius]